MSQQTRRSERAWNYIGAVAHWIYPMILRQHWVLWDQVVWLLSFLGVVTTGVGLCIGVVRFRQARRSMRERALSPFSGWLRWHHLLGLVFGIIVFTWMLSGWLSMDHGRLFSMSSPTARQIQNFQGVSLSQVAKSIKPAALETLGEIKELEFLAVGRRPLVLAKGSETQLYTPVESYGFSSFILTKEEVVDAVKQVWFGFEILQIEEIKPDDSYGHLREGPFPKQTLRVGLDDPNQTWVHVDMQTGTIVSVMDHSRRIYRWLFNGLHSLDFPGLIERRPLWDVVMFTLLTLGFLFSLTGVVVGWKKVL